MLESSQGEGAQLLEGAEFHDPYLANNGAYGQLCLQVRYHGSQRKFVREALGQGAVGNPIRREVVPPFGILAAFKQPVEIPMNPQQNLICCSAEEQNAIVAGK